MTVPMRQKTLEEILVRRGWLYPERATAQAQEAKRIRHPLRQHLLKERVLLEERLAEATAEQFGLRFDPLTAFLDLSDRIKEMTLDRPRNSGAWRRRRG